MWCGMGAIRISLGPEIASKIWKSEDTLCDC